MAKQLEGQKPEFYRPDRGWGDGAHCKTGSLDFIFSCPGRGEKKNHHRPLEI